MQNTPIIPSITHHTVGTHMQVHTQTHIHALWYAKPSHTHLHPLYREPYVCVWSYSRILYVRIYNQTYPLLRASSLSCCDNITQMQAEKGKK